MPSEATPDSATVPRVILVGSYTAELGGRGTGVTSYRRLTDGSLEPIAQCPMPSPSWLEWHPYLPVLYCANEVNDGTVNALRVMADGSMTLLGAVPTSGAVPCHLAVSADARFLLVANYESGSTCVISLDPDGGLGEQTDLVQHRALGLTPGPMAERQDGPHAHMVVISDDHVLVVDLGLDAVLAFRLDDAGRLQYRSASRLSAGTGPRQLVRRPGGSTALVLGELSGTLTLVQETDPGEFTELMSVPSSSRPGHAQCAQLVVAPDGGWALASNRRVDTLSLFDLRGDSLTLIDEYSVGPGWPRHFAVIDEHVYVGNQDGDEIIVFALDPGSGRLTRVGATPSASPVCIVSRLPDELASVRPATGQLRRPPWLPPDQHRCDRVSARHPRTPPRDAPNP
jgi:6-phosphogluconolactonase (cycloisomerase 2 family)